MGEPFIQRRDLTWASVSGASTAGHLQTLINRTPARRARDPLLPWKHLLVRWCLKNICGSLQLFQNIPLEGEFFVVVALRVNQHFYITAR